MIIVKQTAKKTLEITKSTTLQRLKNTQNANVPSIEWPSDLLF